LRGKELVVNVRGGEEGEIREGRVDAWSYIKYYQ
jgi:hypothetical protein